MDDPETIAYSEANRALDHQWAERDTVRSRAVNLFVAAGVVSSFFAALAIVPGHKLSLDAQIAIGMFCGVAASTLLIQWPWRGWKWAPGAVTLVVDYVDGYKRLEGLAMQRDLAINLGNNATHNRKWMNVLHGLQMVGILCLCLEVVFWLRSI